MRSHTVSPKMEKNPGEGDTRDTNLEEGEPFVIVEHHLEALVVDDGEEAGISKIINSLR